MRALITTLFLSLAAYVCSAQVLGDTTFTIPIYNINVRITIAENLHDIACGLSPDTQAITWVQEGTVCVLFASGSVDVETVFHECAHVINFIYSERGVELNVNEDENQAYLTGYIGARMVPFISKTLIKAIAQSKVLGARP
jgi:hypothetical protein